MSTGPRILFYTSNRRGLGHLMRGLNIATALKEQDRHCDILFYSRGKPPEGFTELDVHFFLESEDGSSSCPKVVRSFKPHIVVYDTMLPQTPEDLPAIPNTKSVYIMRKCSEKRQAEIFRHWSMSDMSLIIVPHEPAEFSHPIPTSLANKTHFVGAIVRKPNDSKSAVLAEKYGLTNGAFSLLSTPGGGGFIDEAKTFFEVVKHVHRRMIIDFPDLQHVVVKGPKYPHKLQPLDGMHVVGSEPDLVHLLPCMSLVISAGGYNTVTEIRVAKTPAVFLPSPRTHDDQLERVTSLQKAGLACVCADLSEGETAQSIGDLATSPTELSRMRENYAKDSLTIGNGAAARLILELGNDYRIA